MNKINLCDKLNNIVSKLTAISDFTKRIGDDSFILEEETPFGLHLFMGDCIDDLKTIINILNVSN